ncbi:hypothetical protein ABTJ06_19630, partial [Acinetobacter baumannii]
WGRGAALCRSAGRRGRGRHAWGHGAGMVAVCALPADDAGGRAGGRSAAAGPSADEGAAGGGRGGDHAAAQLHHAA